jgi:hypothetical protein
LIKQWENGVRVIELGKGTTFIGQVFVDGGEASSGLYFTNEKNFNGRYKGEEVIIEMTNFKGVLSYMRGAINLLQTWEVEGVQDQLDEMAKQIEGLIKSIQ